MSRILQAPFEGSVKLETQNGILFGYSDYLTLVDDTGRVQRNDKRGFIPEKSLPILDRLAIDSDDWLENTQNFEKVFYRKLYYRKKDRAA